MYFTASASIFKAWPMALAIGNPIGDMGFVSEMLLCSGPGAMSGEADKGLGRGERNRFEGQG